jgi:ATP adenylyltransferase
MHEFCSREEAVAMKTLWAPWRIEYIRSRKPTGCIFCLNGSDIEDRDCLVLHRSPHSIIMLNRYPYSNGHILVAPHRHLPDLNGLTGAEAADLFAMVRLSCNVLQEAASPEGYNIGVNLGKAAGAGVEDHFHLHVVPRWQGDTNFMSVVADLRVMPENLMATYDTLLPVFTAMIAESEA